jgi:Uma2 family endonuclease
MTIGARLTPSDSPARAKVPWLDPGDQLTRDEFERRFDATPGLKKAELIEGVVYMPPAVRWDLHSEPHSNLVTWMGVYRAGTPGVRGSDNGSVRIDLENEPQPDAALLIDPARGGQASHSADDYIEGAPELVAEVSGSTASIDLNAKLRVYRRNGVREYLVWRIYDGAIDWFVLRQGNYEQLPLHPDGTLRSETFPGLWLDAAAMIKGDIAAVLRVVQQGLQTPEHAAFVAKLQSAK